MFKSRILKLIIYNSLVLSLIGIIVFAIVAIWDYAWLVGWSVGAASAVTSFLLNVWTINLLFKTKRSKRRGFWIGLLRSLLALFYYMVWIFAVIMINATAHHQFLFKTNSQAMLSPINLIACLLGMSVILMATFAAHLPIFKEKTDG